MSPFSATYSALKPKSMQWLQTRLMNPSPAVDHLKFGGVNNNYLKDPSWICVQAKKRWAHHRPGHYAPNFPNLYSAQRWSGGRGEGGDALRCILKTKPDQILWLCTDPRDITRVSSDSSFHACALLTTLMQAAVSTSCLCVCLRNERTVAPLWKHFSTSWLYVWGS